MRRATATQGVPSRITLGKTHGHRRTRSSEALRHGLCTRRRGHRARRAPAARAQTGHVRPMATRCRSRRPSRSRQRSTGTGWSATSRPSGCTGIGPFGALLLQAEIGPSARFGSAQELAAYAGLVPSTRSSGVRRGTATSVARIPGSNGFSSRRSRRRSWRPARWEHLSKIAAREGKAEGDRRGCPKVLHIPVLDAEGGVELHRMASST